MESFGFGCLYWILFSLLALLPHYLFDKAYPNHPLLSYIFPIGYTMVTHSIVGNTFSTISALSDAMLDYAPLMALASLLGVASITFFVTLLSTSAALTYASKPYAFVVFKATFAVMAFLMICTGFLIQAPTMYQMDVGGLIVPQVNVSCVFADSVEVSSNEMNEIYSQTRMRVLAGDAIVLWSEEAVFVRSDADENALLDNTRALVALTNATSVGVTYQKQLDGDDMGTNQFALITPRGEIAWRYWKAHPVPLVESNIVPGANILPTYVADEGGALQGMKLGGAICFDMNYPSFILQAGWKKVDLLLQPSWTWGALDTRHFTGNALRAAENGFTHFRCSSDSESGIVDPRGRIMNRIYTGHDPSVVTVFSLPLLSRVTTLYASAGFLFEWLVLALAIVVYVLLAIPASTFDAKKAVFDPVESWVIHAGLRLSHFTTLVYDTHSANSRLSPQLAHSAYVTISSGADSSRVEGDSSASSLAEREDGRTPLISSGTAGSNK